MKCFVLKTGARCEQGVHFCVLLSYNIHTFIKLKTKHCLVRLLVYVNMCHNCHRAPC